MIDVKRKHPDDDTLTPQTNKLVSMACTQLNRKKKSV